MHKEYYIGTFYVHYKKQIYYTLDSHNIHVKCMSTSNMKVEWLQNLLTLIINKNY